MSTLKSILDITAEEWLNGMNLASEDIPDVVIVEGSWWRQQRTDWRLGYLTDVRELAFPDIFWGRWRDKKIVFSCAYGAPRTVEIIHIFTQIGTKLAIQIGTCGGLQSHLKSGDVVLPDFAFCRDGVANLYDAQEVTMGFPEQLSRAQQLLETRGHTTYRGPHMTWSSLFTETAVMMTAWHQAGYLSVDMETATTYAVARYFGQTAVSMLVVWDDLTRGKRFLDPLTETEQVALDRANQSVYEVALEMAEGV
ncbi:MAG: nucleoside phosphorylase [Chloroflexi bacterium]|nr:nucleoside phosphorylase [Chloroflexota bacterium]